MLIREAVQLIQAAKWSASRRLALVCSFEPLHLATYLQAHMVARAPEDAPRLVKFGYDQLQEGLAHTAGELQQHPAVLHLSWDDLHPALSWRCRSDFGCITDHDVLQQAQRLRQRLLEWIAARPGAETYVILPPQDWLPLHDSCSSAAQGPIHVAAVSALHEIAHALTVAGARLLRVAGASLNYRELLQSGCPLTLEDSQRLARHVCEVVYRMGRMKAIVTDLDGTLWSGVIGEDGPENLRRDVDGKEATYTVFQKFLLKLKNQGILLAFCTKNNPDEVFPLFDRLQMPLRLADFSAARCDWDPKPQNILAIASDLNIGVEDVIVIDDNPAELALLRAQLPHTLSLQTPREGSEWKQLFAQLQDLCGTWRISEEDRIRSQSATTQRRQAAMPQVPQAGATGADRWDHLKELVLEVTINRQAFDDPRCLELINKTNQFNLSGQRMTNEEWLVWAQTPGAFCLSGKLRDRFGDFGTIAVLTGQRRENQTLWIRQFVLSCRAFGRGVEMVMLDDLLHQNDGWHRLMGSFTPTQKNTPAKKFLDHIGALACADGWELSRRAVEGVVDKIIQEANIRVISAHQDGPSPSMPGGGAGFAMEKAAA